MGLAMITALLFLGITAVFCFQNTDPVTVSFLMTKFEMPMWGLFVIFLVLGLIIARGIFALRRAEYLDKIRNKNKKIASLRKEISALESATSKKNPDMSVEGLLDIDKILDLVSSSSQEADKQEPFQKSVAMDIPVKKSAGPAPETVKNSYDKSEKSVNTYKPDKKAPVTKVTKDEKKYEVKPRPAAAKKPAVSKKPAKTEFKMQSTAVNRFSLKDDYKKHMQAELKNIEKLIDESQMLQDMARPEDEEIQSANIRSDSQTSDTLVAGNIHKNFGKPEVSKSKKKTPVFESREKSYPSKRLQAIESGRPKIDEGTGRLAAELKPDFLGKKSKPISDGLAQTSQAPAPDQKLHEPKKSEPNKKFYEHKESASDQRVNEPKKYEDLNLGANFEKDFSYGASDHQETEKSFSCEINDRHEPERDFSNEANERHETAAQNSNADTVSSLEFAPYEVKIAKNPGTVAQNPQSMYQRPEINSWSLSDSPNSDYPGGFVKIENYEDEESCVKLSSGGLGNQSVKDSLDIKTAVQTNSFNAQNHAGSGKLNIKMDQSLCEDTVRQSMNFDKTAFTAKLLSPELVSRKFNWGYSKTNAAEETEQKTKGGFLRSLFSIN